VLNDQIARLLFPNHVSNPEKVKRIDIPQYRIGKYIHQNITFRQPGIIFCGTYTGHLLIPRKIFVE
jgi:hypothetical protein